MTIVPDAKDWTWVLDRPCGECGFDASQVTYDELAGLVRDGLPVWSAVLARPDATRRPNPETWSDLEYGAHVRDVFRVFTGRLELVLAHDDPVFPNWDQDATAIIERYGEQDPGLVASELVDAGLRAADAFGGVRPDDRGRAGLRSNGSAFTVETLGKYFVHDFVHHLHDVGARD